MSFITRSFVYGTRGRALPLLAAKPRRFAHSSYGNEQSGHEQGLNEKNPKRDLEHPGPPPPDTQGQGQSQTPSQSQSSSSSSTSGEGSAKIQTPKSAAEDTDPEVKKHNEEMANRAEKTTNQLSEDDNKVDKKFWTGNVGAKSHEK